MLVPSFLFGTATEVRANVAKALTQLRRGASLEEICEKSGRVDLREHPEGAVWIHSKWVLRSADARDFRAVLLTMAVFDSDRIPFDKSNELRETSVDYLSHSPWGSVLLNSGQGGVWFTALPLRPYRPSRRGHVAILRGTSTHWGALTGLGARYYAGGAEFGTFSACLPAYGHALAVHGLDPSAARTDGHRSGWLGIDEIEGVRSLIERIESDDGYWTKWDRTERSRHGTPDLTPENADEITRLCESGSWDKDQWEFLKSRGGQAAVDRALKVLELAGRWDALLGVFVHVLGDMNRAADIFFAHRTEVPALDWAAPRIAAHLRKAAPEQAASLLFEEAERHLTPGNEMVYRASVDTLREAKALLLDVHAEAAWGSRCRAFYSAHRRRKNLAVMLEAAFPELRGAEPSK